MSNGIYISKKEAEAYEQKLVELEKKLAKAQKTIRQDNAAHENLLNKIRYILQSDMDFIGEDYENEIPDRQIEAIEKIINKY